jgi:hypothetical protein
VSPVVKDAFRRLSRNRQHLWLWVPAFAGTTMVRVSIRIRLSNESRTFAFPRRDAPGLCPRHCPSTTRGRRESRVRAAPAVSRAKGTRKCAHEHTGSAEAIRPSLRNGFNGFLRALLGDRAFLPPSPANCSADLTPASGRQDHTTSPSASGALVSSPISVHRIQPRVRDDRDTPLCGVDGGVMKLICVKRKERNFCGRD